MKKILIVLSFGLILSGCDIMAAGAAGGASATQQAKKAHKDYENAKKAEEVAEQKIKDADDKMKEKIEEATH